MTSEKEYVSLRNEILLWQNRRFLMLSATIVIITAIFGLNKGTGNSIPAHLISAILLLFLSGACLLTAYCGRSSAILGAFIQVFYENKNPDLKWERMNSKFPRKWYEMNLNAMIAIIYLIFGVSSIYIPFYMYGSGNDVYEYFKNRIVIIFAAIFFGTFIHLLKSQYFREDYVSIWEAVEAEQLKG